MYAIWFRKKGTSITIYSAANKAAKNTEFHTPTNALLYTIKY